MTLSELTAILGSRMIRSTTHPAVFNLRPRLWFGNDWEKLERMINAILKSYPKVFFCPYEPWEISGARYQAWDQIEDNTWAVPSTAIADAIINNREYPYGWTLYAATVPLTESEWSKRPKDPIASLGALIDDGRIEAFIGTDPDGVPEILTIGF